VPRRLVAAHERPEHVERAADVVEDPSAVARRRAALDGRVGQDERPRVVQAPPVIGRHAVANHYVVQRQRDARPDRKRTHRSPTRKDDPASAVDHRVHTDHERRRQHDGVIEGPTVERDETATEERRNEGLLRAGLGRTVADDAGAARRAREHTQRRHHRPRHHDRANPRDASTSIRDGSPLPLQMVESKHAKLKPTTHAPRRTRVALCAVDRRLTRRSVKILPWQWVGYGAGHSAGAEASFAWYFFPGSNVVSPPKRMQ
jgi:hypothetical protein